MLAKITPRQFEELMAATIVGSNPDEWKQMAHLATAITNKLDLLIAISAPGVELTQSLPEDFLPKGYRDILGMAKRNTADQEALDRVGKQMKAKYG